MKPRAFTLIELLIVIAIIAILSAILFPVFFEAREKARSTACLSNLKQLGLAYAQYEQDYDETVVDGSVSSGCGAGWAGEIYPYVKSAAVFVCPDDVTPGDVVSYAINSNLVLYNTQNRPVPAIISQMTMPSKTVLLFEVTNSSGYSVMTPQSDNQDSPCGCGANYSTSPTKPLSGHNQGLAATDLKYATGVFANSPAVSSNSAPYDNNPNDITPTNSYFISSSGRHQNGSNFLMADDHAKWLPPTSVGAGLDFTSGLAVYDPASCPPTFNARAPLTSCNKDANSNPIQYGATFAIH